MEHTAVTIGTLTFDAVVDGPPEGDLVVLLHGFPQQPDAWAGVQPALGAVGHRSVAPALRGYSAGARPSAVADYAVERSVADVVGLAAALGAERFHVVGHDWGGAVAWAIAADPPPGLASVAVLSTPHPAALPEVAWRSLQPLRSAYIPLFRWRGVSERLLLARDAALLRRFLVGSGLGPAHVARYAAAMQQPGALTAALNWYRAIGPSLLRTGPAQVPTTYVWSSGDVALGRAAAERTARHVRATYRFEVLEGVPHWIPEEAPDQVSALLLEHLRAQSG